MNRAAIVDVHGKHARIIGGNGLVEITTVSDGKHETVICSRREAIDLRDALTLALDAPHETFTINWDARGFAG